MAKTYIVVHYHELWLKGGNRRFFLGKLITGLKRALEGAGLEKMHCPGDRILLQFREGVSVADAVERISWSAAWRISLWRNRSAARTRNRIF